MISRPCPSVAVVLCLAIGIGACEDSGVNPGTPHSNGACTDYRLNPHVTGSYRADASTVTVVEPLAFVAAGDSLLILDVSNPSAPSLAGSLSLYCYEEIAVAGNYAYVCVDAPMSHGLTIVDVGNPAAPVIAGNAALAGWPEAVEVSGSYAYLGDSNGLHIIDVSNPAQPSVVGNTLQGRSSGIALEGNYAFVCDPGAEPYEGSLYSIDVSNPASPTVVDSVASDSPMDVAIDGTYAYLAVYPGHLQVVDISDPAHMVTVGDLRLNSLAVGVTISGDYAYVANNGMDCRIVDVSNPSDPVLASGIDAPGYTRGLAVSGSHVYMAQGEASPDGTSLVAVADVSSPVTDVLGSLPGDPSDGFGVPDYISPIRVLNQMLCTLHNGNLELIDASHPQSPHILGTFSNSSTAFKGIAVAGSRAYLTSQSSFDIVDISQPSDPTAAGNMDLYSAEGLAVAGRYAYVAHGHDGLEVIDVSGAPHIIGHVDTPGAALDVAILGTRAFVADQYGGVQVVDVSKPTSPAIVGHVDTSGQVLRAVPDGGYLYILEGLDGIRIATLGNQPVVVGHLDTFHAQDIAFNGSFAYVADNSSVQVVDRSRPQAPVTVGIAVTRGGLAIGVAASNALWVASGDAGLLALPLQCPQH